MPKKTRQDDLTKYYDEQAKKENKNDQINRELFEERTLQRKGKKEHEKPVTEIKDKTAALPNPNLFKTQELQKVLDDIEKDEKKYDSQSADEATDEEDSENYASQSIESSNESDNENESSGENNSKSALNFESYYDQKQKQEQKNNKINQELYAAYKLHKQQKQAQEKQAIQKHKNEQSKKDPGKDEASLKERQEHKRREQDKKNAAAAKLFDTSGHREFMKELKNREELKKRNIDKERKSKNNSKLFSQDPPKKPHAPSNDKVEKIIQKKR